MFDLFQSRRGYNEYCKWWSQNESEEISFDKLVSKRVPSGCFYAKEVNPETSQNAIIGGTFMFDKTTITIKTPDNVLGIKNNDIVLFRGEKWIVIDVQKRQSHLQQSEFANDENVSHYWYISLRK